MGHHVRLLPPLALLLAGAAASVSAGDGSDSVTPLAEVMRELSSRFTSTARALTQGDGDGAADGVAGLRAATERLMPLAPEGDGGFRAHVQRLATLSAEVDTLLAAGRRGGALQAFEELRTTCVTCHVRHRAENVERGMFPAADNVVSGTVELFDLDGEPLADRGWILVFLESPKPRPRPHLRDAPALSQQGRQFHPRVLPVVAGTRVDFPNDDTIFHNVFSLSRVAPFDLGVYEPGGSRQVTMRRPGLVRVFCNIHPEMAASIVVLREPWFALTDAEGSFILPGAPDGHYVLRAWNDRGVDHSEELELAGGEWRTVSLSLRETRRVLPHKNKFGKDYGDKYR